MRALRRNATRKRTRSQLKRSQRIWRTARPSIQRFRSTGCLPARPHMSKDSAPELVRDSLATIHNRAIANAQQEPSILAQVAREGVSRQQRWITITSESRQTTLRTPFFASDLRLCPGDRHAKPEVPERNRRNRRRNVRRLRNMIGMSQETLGEKPGLTFQQVQKKGTNRISASNWSPCPRRSIAL